MRTPGILLLSCLLLSLPGCAPRDGTRSPVLGTLVAVPGGSFLTGAGDRAEVAPFLMGATEITRTQYRAVMGEDPSDPEVSSGPDDPVQRVNWYEALVFCNRLSLREGLAPVYSLGGSARAVSAATAPVRSDRTWDGVRLDPAADGYRLPSVGEWLWAALGASDSGGTGWEGAFAGASGGGTLGESGWYAGNSGRRTHPAGTKRPNALGFYDLAGNVFEWCQDRLAPQGNYRVDLGGSWLNDEASASLAWRRPTLPSFKHSNIGFRVVRNR